VVIAMVLYAIFNHNSVIMAVSFISGGNHGTQELNWPNTSPWHTLLHNVYQLPAYLTTQKGID